MRHRERRGTGEVRDSRGENGSGDKTLDHRHK